MKQYETSSNTDDLERQRNAPPQTAAQLGKLPLQADEIIRFDDPSLNYEEFSNPLHGDLEGPFSSSDTTTRPQLNNLQTLEEYLQIHHR